MVLSVVLTDTFQCLYRKNNLSKQAVIKIPTKSECKVYFKEFEHKIHSPKPKFWDSIFVRDGTVKQNVLTKSMEFSGRLV